MFEDLKEASMYKVKYYKNGYEYQLFVYREDLIDRLAGFSESGLKVQVEAYVDE